MLAVYQRSVVGQGRTTGRIAAPVNMFHDRLKFLKAAKKRTHDSGVEHGDDGVGHSHSKRRSMQERRERTSIEQWHEARKSRYVQPVVVWMRIR